VGLGLAVALAISLAGTMATVFSLGSGNNDYTVKVHFPTANGLIDGSDVFFGGVKVGTVASVVVDNTPPADSGNSSFANPTSTALATITIQKQYAPLHLGATAAIRPKSLLGEKYVAMTVGDPGKEAIADGSILPPDATSVNVELDQLVNTFDEATRQQLHKLINNLGQGLAGQGRNTNQTFQVGQQDLGNFAQVTDVLQTRDAELKRVIEALTNITQTLSSDQQRSNYPDLLRHSDTVLKTLIAQDADVQQGIDRMNAFFAVLEAGFGGRQQDMQAVLAALPRTISDLDALAATLGPEGHVALSVVQSAAPALIASDLVFGATPVNHTYTNDIFARVLPAQGCSTLGTRAFNASGVANDTPPPPASGPSQGEICTIPSLRQQCFGTFCFRACDNFANIHVNTLLGCAGDLTGGLCVTFGFNVHDPGFAQNGGCNGPTAGNGGGPFPSTARGTLGLPLQPTSADQQAANDSLVTFLIR
jgi:virulence factor Mce-like protein